MKNLLTMLLGCSLITCISCDQGTIGSDAQFYDVTVSLSPMNAGSILPSPDSSYDADAKVNFEAVPSDGYNFISWSGDVNSGDNPISVTVDEDKSLTANFEKKSYALVIKTKGEGDVTEKVIQRKSKDYEHGTVVELTANAVDGWKFIEWTGDINVSENPLKVSVESPMEITAVFNNFYFAENEVTVTCEDAEVGESGTVSGVTYTKRTADQITVYNAENSCTSGITDMSGMFYNATLFNKDISSWDVSSVTDMTNMFIYAEAFNSDVSHWDVSNVTNMNGMFTHASSFNSELSHWDVSNVTNMRGMFSNAISFNGDISNWDVSSVTDMYAMFYIAESFDADISSWDVSNVTNMSLMFVSAKSFNADISSWNVGNVTFMRGMFSSASSFNADISSWDVSNVKNISSMFHRATSFNRDISSWEVSNVEEMSNLFSYAASFNADISSWDVSNVTDMYRMFYNASSFNQNISGWCVSNITSEPEEFATNSPLLDNQKPVWGTCPSQ
ncbi:MAG: BspA family leucine-rich repeat surface protein [Bacteroidota bacterium]